MTATKVNESLSTIAMTFINKCTSQKSSQRFHKPFETLSLSDLNLDIISTQSPFEALLSKSTENLRLSLPCLFSFLPTSLGLSIINLPIDRQCNSVKIAQRLIVSLSWWSRRSRTELLCARQTAYIIKSSQKKVSSSHLFFFSYRDYYDASNSSRPMTECRKYSWDADGHRKKIFLTTFLSHFFATSRRRWNGNLSVTFARGSNFDGWNVSA